MPQTCSAYVSINQQERDTDPKQYSTGRSLLCNSSLSLSNWNFPNFYRSIPNQAVSLSVSLLPTFDGRALSLVTLLFEINILQVKQRSQYTTVFGDQCKWICSALYWFFFLPTLPLSPRKLFKSYKAQMNNMFQQGPVSSLPFLFWPWFNDLLRLQVMTVGPFRPVLSWIWDIFSAIAIRGLSTAWRERNTCQSSNNNRKLWHSYSLSLYVYSIMKHQAESICLVKRYTKCA